MKVFQYKTSIKLDTLLLSAEQKAIRLCDEPINEELFTCSCCKEDKPKKCYRIRKHVKGHIGEYRVTKCKECNARKRGTVQHGKNKFAKEILNKGFKRCTICKTIKPFDEFHKNKHHTGGINPTCKPCHQTDRAIRKLKKRTGKFKLEGARVSKWLPEEYKSNPKTWPVLLP